MSTSLATSAAVSLAGAQMPGDDEPKRRDPIQNIIILISFGLCACTAVFNIIAVAVYPVTVVIVATVVGILVAGYAAFQRFQLIKMETFRQIMNELRGEVGRLRQTNDELTEENDKLKVQVDKVKEIEEGLGDIVTRQGQSVDSFIKAVKDNQIVLDQMKELCKSQVLQNMVSIVLRADRDRDSTIDPEEIRMLVLLLQNATEVTFDEKKFEARLAKTDYSITAVIKLCRQLVMENEDVIKVDPKKYRPKF